MATWWSVAGTSVSNLKRQLLWTGRFDWFSFFPLRNTPQLMWIVDSQAKINFSNNNSVPASPTLASMLTAKTVLWLWRYRLGTSLQPSTSDLGTCCIHATEIGVKDIIAISMIACSRPSDSRAQCSESGEQVKSYAEETKGEPHLIPRQFFNRTLLSEPLEQTKGFCCIYSLIQT